jgi:DNA repair protein RecO (recombination protein O)
MRSYKATGIILKRRDIGESDRIITVFTKEEGKIHLKAKGVRKISSKRAPHIEPFNHVIFTMYKSEKMSVLTEIVTIESYTMIKNDLSRVGFAYHICELIDSLCPEGQELCHVFTLLERVLKDLTRKTRLGEVIHQFEMELLALLGYISSTYELEGAKASYFIESILERKLKTRQILPNLF